jgi:hypothetical protein
MLWQQGYRRGSISAETASDDVTLEAFAQSSRSGWVAPVSV